LGKTKVICSVHGDLTTTSRYRELNWVEEPTRILGIFIPYTDKGNYKKNLLTKTDKLNTKLDIWRIRNYRSSVSVLLPKA